MFGKLLLSLSCNLSRPPLTSTTLSNVKYLQANVMPLLDSCFLCMAHGYGPYLLEEYTV